MKNDLYLAALRDNPPSIAEAARLGVRAPVPSCPGWTVADLLVHIGSVQRIWNAHLQARSKSIVEVPPEIYDSVPGLASWAQSHQEGSSDARLLPEGTVEWFEEGAIELEETFRNADPDESVWHWSGDHRVASHLRMQAVEVTVHRWDAQSAQGHPEPIETAMAADGIDHALDVALPHSRRDEEARPGSGESYHLHRTDGLGEWLIRFNPDGAVVTREHARAGVAIRGSAEDLFLFLWGRADRDRLEVLGDRALLDRYSELVPPM